MQEKHYWVNLSPKGEGQLVNLFFIRFIGISFCLCVTSVTNILNNPGITSKELQTIDTTLSKKTIGNLIQEIKKHSTIPDNMGTMLDDFRETRNKLIHRFFDDYAYRFPTEEGCLFMVEKLKEMNDILVNADRMVTTMSRSLRQAMGINEEILEKQADSILCDKTGINIRE